jgi:small subunit ribosomal protein S1
MTHERAHAGDLEGGGQTPVPAPPGPHGEAGAGQVQAEEYEEPTYSMSELLDESLLHKRVEQGDLCKGVVVNISANEILVDIGTKSEGVISGRELERLEPETLKNLKVGDEITAYVVRVEDRDGNVVLSLARAQAEQDWQNAQSFYRAGKCFEGTAVDYNKGGLIVKCGSLRGFVPASELSDCHRIGAKGLADMVGQVLRLKIIELDRQRNRLILSERLAMREWRQEQKEKLLSELKEGDILEGEVSSLCDFGAFIDLGGADGLVHLSELSWGRISHPEEVLRVGDRVSVYILNVDRERNRIGLSIKRLQPEPWAQVEKKYAVGQLVEGEITKLTNFGAFARIDTEIEGLIHISELSDKQITHPKEVVKKGDVLTLRIIRIDPERRRMALSLRQVADERYVGLDWRAEYQAGIAEE